LLAAYYRFYYHRLYHNDQTERNQPDSRWGPTQDGVRQHLPSKIWHYNKKVCRHLISGSSETTSKTLAKTKLAKEIADFLKQPGSLTAPVKNGRQTFADVIDVFKHRLAATSVAEGTQAKKLNNIQSIPQDVGPSGGV
jgi:hypothetical protein